MNESNEVPPAVPIASVAAMDVDMPCIGCGYNLRSIPMEGRCPECGRTVLASMRDGWLIFAEREWLRKVRKGIDISLWLMLGSVIGVILLVAYFMASFTNQLRPPNPVDFQIFTLVLSVGFIIVWQIAVWYLTTPEGVNYDTVTSAATVSASSSITKGDKPVVKEHRTTLSRWCVVLNALPIFSVVLYSLAFPYVIAQGQQPGLLGALLLGGSTIGWIGGSIGYLLLFIHLRRIARRDVRKGLGKLMTFLIWGMVVTTGLGFVFGLLIAGLSRFAPTMVMTTATTTNTSASLYSIGYASGVAVTTNVATDSEEDADDESADEESTSETDDAGYVASYPVGSGPTTMPGATTLPPRMGLLFPLILIFACSVELFGLAWLICGVIATFMFRGMLTRSIEQNMGHVWRGFATTG